MHLRKIFTSIIVVCLVIIIQSCDSYTIQYPEPDDESITYSKTIQSIFNKKCTLCHNGSLAGQSPDLSKEGSYLALTNGGFIDIVNPEASLLIQKLENESNHGGSGITPADISTILAWITAGAPND